MIALPSNMQLIWTISHGLLPGTSVTRWATYEVSGALVDGTANGSSEAGALEDAASKAANRNHRISGVGRLRDGRLFLLLDPITGSAPVPVAVVTPENGVPKLYLGRVPCVGDVVVAAIGEDEPATWEVVSVLHTAPSAAGEPFADVHVVRIDDFDEWAGRRPPE
jgi:hypothetical protein